MRVTLNHSSIMHVNHFRPISCAQFPWQQLYESAEWSWDDYVGGECCKTEELEVGCMNGEAGHTHTSVCMCVCVYIVCVWQILKLHCTSSHEAVLWICRRESLAVSQQESLIHFSFHGDSRGMICSFQTEGKTWPLALLLLCFLPESLFGHEAASHLSHQPANQSLRHTHTHTHRGSNMLNTLSSGRCGCELVFNVFGL